MKKLPSYILLSIPAALLGVAILSAASVPPADPGQEIYIARCLSCHQMNGEGVPGAFPPLTESEWVEGDKGVLIRMLLQGLGGTITVKGQQYGGLMPPWGAFLNDEEVAQVLTYIRMNFGNDASEVTAAEVSRVREMTKDRTTHWTAEELALEENQGTGGLNLFGNN